MRTRFDEQLAQLDTELISMGALCEDAVGAAVESLEGDPALRERAFALGRAIDRQERDIETLCMKLLLQQQPVARDLRTISSALKMISDMQRIGDQAADIAETSVYVARNDTQSRIHIRDMGDAVRKMVTDSVSSFVQKDLALARAVIAYDDVVDDHFDRVRRELIALLGEKNASGEVCVDLLIIAKYLERSADHAVNIAQWVEYCITGQHAAEGNMEDA